MPRTRSRRSCRSGRRPPRRCPHERDGGRHPTAADTKLWNASCVICEKYDIVDSPAYDCQFVFVVNEADVSNACRSRTLARCSGLSGSASCNRSTTYVTSNPVALKMSRGRVGVARPM